MKKICNNCGKEFETHKVRKIYCSQECNRIANANKAKERNRKIRIGDYNPSVDFNARVKKTVCRECGKEFEFVNGTNTCYCSDECRKNAVKKQIRQHQEEFKSERLKAKSEKKPKKPRKGSLMRAEREARKQGLSYGQYKAMQYMQQNDEVGKVRL